MYCKALFAATRGRTLGGARHPANEPFTKLVPRCQAGEPPEGSHTQQTNHKVGHGRFSGFTLTVEIYILQGFNGVVLSPVEEE